MENTETNNTKNDINKKWYNSIKAFFVKDYTNAIRKKKEHQKKEEKAAKIEEGSNKIKLPEIVNVIFTIILAGATVVLAYFTFQLFNETKKARKDNEQVIANTNKSVKEQIVNDSALRKNDSIKFSSDTSYSNKKYFNDSSNNKKNFQIAQNALNAQEKSLKQTQEDFETENRPLLVFANFKVDTTFPNNIVTVDFTYQNVGKFPAKTFYSDQKVDYGFDTLHLLAPNPNWTSSGNNEFISNNLLANAHVFTGIDNYFISVFKKGIIHIFVFIDIRYYSSVLKKKYYCYMVWQITSMEGGKMDVSPIANTQ